MGGRNSRAEDGADTGNGGALTGEGLPCPVNFDPEDVIRTLALDKKLRRADENMWKLGLAIGFASAGWVPIDRYVEVKADVEKMKRQVWEMLTTDEDRANTKKHWPLDDMNEED